MKQTKNSSLLFYCVSIYMYVYVCIHVYIIYIFYVSTHSSFRVSGGTYSTFQESIFFSYGYGKFFRFFFKMNQHSDKTVTMATRPYAYITVVIPTLSSVDKDSKAAGEGPLAARAA